MEGQANLVIWQFMDNRKKNDFADSQVLNKCAELLMFYVMA